MMRKIPHFILSYALFKLNPSFAILCDINSKCPDGQFCNYGNVSDGVCEYCSYPCDDLLTPEGVADCKFICSSARYDIGESVYNFVDAQTIRVSNTIGVSVKGSENVLVELFGSDCQTPKSALGLEVELYDDPYDEDLIFHYDVVINFGLINSSPGGFVSFGDHGFSKGVIDFCTRVSTWEGSLQIFFRDSIFNLGFDLTDINFAMDDTIAQTSNETEVIIDADTDFKVSGCPCDSTFDCVEDAVINQGESLEFCIYPDVDSGSSADPSNLRISNFNILMSTGSGENVVEFEPVSFGSSHWDVNSLAKTYEQNGRIKVVAPVTASFFIKGHTELDISGNAFLDFVDSSKATNLPQFLPFGVTIQISAQSRKGLFRLLLNQFLSNLFMN